MTFDISLDKSENAKAENTGTSNGIEDAPLETNVDLSKAAFQMSTLERLHTTCRLWKYMIPLFVVYFAEYATQSGTWAAIGFLYPTRQQEINSTSVSIIIICLRQMPPCTTTKSNDDYFDQMLISRIKLVFF